MFQLFLLALAGAAGTLARYGLATLSSRWFGTAFPWGTLVVNLLGCVLFGWIWTLTEERKIISEQDRLIILTGFAGAFTTFSTFAFETADRLRGGDLWGFGLNLAVQNLFGLLAVFLGILLGRRF